MNYFISFLPLLVILIHILLFVIIFLRILKNKTLSKKNKIFWIILIFAVPLLGIIAYILMTSKS